MYTQSFFDTSQGQHLLQYQIPALIEGMENLTNEIKRANDLKEAEIKRAKEIEEKR